ncbi:MAG: hypothetical protein K5838_04960 [Elusimicrobiales bacterium]|nr:hypothetical protein [Elusimicrobiales bacterium]
MLTKQHFSELLMESAPASKGEGDSYYVAIPPDEKRSYEVIANFFYEKERIIFLAHAPKMKLKPYDVAQAVCFCNRMNREYLNQVTYFYGEANELRMSACLFTDCYLSDEYIVRNFINFYLDVSANFFARAMKYFAIDGAGN